jgi:hypothetical protein
VPITGYSQDLLALPNLVTPTAFRYITGVINMKEQSGCLSRQKNFIVLILSLGTPVCASGQHSPFAIGARAWAMGNATVTNTDAYSVFTNVAGLGGAQPLAAFTTFDSRYNFEGLHTLGAGFVVPIRSELNAGVTVQRFGDKFYNESILGVGAGHRIDGFSMGLKVNYLQTAVDAPSIIMTRRALVVELGSVVRISPELYFGAHIYNLTQASYSGIYRAKVPTILRFGIRYVPLKTVLLSSELEKDSGWPVSWKMGIAHQVLGKLWLRTGIATRPLTHHFGAGFSASKFAVDYAVHSNSPLGWSHHLSLAYFLKKDKEKEIQP